MPKNEKKQKEYGKPSKLRRQKEEEKRGGRPQGTSDSHPTMETHPGDRVKDPVTGEKPKPVRKPRAKKPKPVDVPEEPATEAPEGDKPLTWESNE